MNRFPHPLLTLLYAINLHTKSWLSTDRIKHNLFYIYIYIFIYLITLNTRNDEIWWFPEMAPQKWMVYFMETPKITWMRTRGIPIWGTPHINSRINQLITFCCFVSQAREAYQAPAVGLLGRWNSMEWLAVSLEIVSNDGGYMAMSMFTVLEATLIYTFYELDERKEKKD